MVDVESGTVLFKCQGMPHAEFLADGKCVVQYFGYQPHGITIDPAHRQFRLHTTDPWLPLEAWPSVEAAYGRGWSACWDFRSEKLETGSGWVEAALAIVSLAVVLILLWNPLFFSWGPRVAVCTVASMGFLLFAWIWLDGIRHRQRVRKLRNPRRSLAD